MDNFYEHHVLHSLAIAAKFEFVKDMQVMDLGCGGGFPGIPLAIFYPETNFHLVDSINKKLKVVSEISSAIGLHNLQMLRFHCITIQLLVVVVTQVVIRK